MKIIIEFLKIELEPPPKYKNVFIIFSTGDLIGILEAFTVDGKIWRLADGTRIEKPEYWAPKQNLLCQ